MATSSLLPLRPQAWGSGLTLLSPPTASPREVLWACFRDHPPASTLARAPSSLDLHPAGLPAWALTPSAFQPRARRSLWNGSHVPPLFCSNPVCLLGPSVAHKASRDPAYSQVASSLPSLCLPLPSLQSRHAGLLGLGSSGPLCPAWCSPQMSAGLSALPSLAFAGRGLL